MKTIIKLEELAMLGFSICALITFDVAWWYYPLLLIGPDISMIGYVAGNKVGAASYNIFHHKGIAILVILAGIHWNIFSLMIVGIVLFGHSSLDRLVGYGLKYNEGFKFTHLGKIGKE